MKLLLRLFSGGVWDQLDLTAQVIDPSDQALDHFAVVAAREGLGAEVFCIQHRFSACDRQR